jgi:glycosyltransferase involved in cell wall biosynthesis
MSADQRRLGVVIGANSLLGHRSGIGRMTLEIIDAVRGRPELGGLLLLMAGKFHEPESVLAGLDAVSAEPEDAPPAAAAPTRRPIAMRAKASIAGVPGVQRLRVVKRRLIQHAMLAELRAAGGGRIVYHEPNMIPQRFGAGPTVVTVNDLSWHHHPEYHPKERLDWIDAHIRRALAEATRFVAISRFTADALTQEFGIAPAMIDVVPLAASSAFAPMTEAAAAPALQRYGLHDRSYVLTVSTLEPRKNFDRLVAAHLLLPPALRRKHPLVVVGGSGWGTTLETPGAEQARRDGTLRLFGHVADEHLVALYARSAAFAYVSIYEGFGLPLIEAMAAGSPVLASSTTATGETAGDAAILADPLDVEQIAAGLRRLLEDEALADAYRARGLAHAAGFTWDRTATALIDTWRRALD